jgi:fructokinase
MSQVICVGELLIDFVAKHHSAAIESAENFTKKAGGAPANVACAVRRLGQKALFAGAVGNDPMGNFLVHTLEAEDIDVSFMQRTKAFTTLAFVALSDEGERDFFFSRGADAGLTYDSKLASQFKDSIVHFGSATAFLEGSLNETYHRYLNDALSSAKLVSFDPNYRSDLWKVNSDSFVEQCLEFSQKAHLCKFSEEEAYFISKQVSHREAAAFFHRLGTRMVCITLGKKGTFLSVNGSACYVESITAQPVDTTAAGDAFIGALLYQFSQQEDPLTCLDDIDTVKEMVRYANKAGAYTTQSYGAIEALPYAKDLEIL